MNILNWICLGVGAVLGPLSFLMRRHTVKKLAALEAPTKKQKRPKTIWTLLSIVGSWMFTVSLIGLIAGPSESEGLNVEIFAPRWNLFGVEISSTIVTTWALMLIIFILALLIRLILVPRMKDRPKGLQNLLEIAVESISKYTKESAPGLTPGLGAYIFSITVFMIFSAGLELFGLRAPTADLTMTFAMALITFVLINYFGLRKKGFGGRIKSMAQPTPVVFPFKIISDIATPVSLACRLFGNMLGGMIVMDLLYTALGNIAVGIPSLLGLYFNVFHPLIQAFIFVTLTLTFIREATEETE